MRKLVLFMHTTLDGFVAGPNGEMDWINIDGEIFDYAGYRTTVADTGLYGRVTYDLMEAYWPTAGDNPDASKHDNEHSEWYNRVEKVIVSKTMSGKDSDKRTIISDNILEQVSALKQQDGGEIVMFGSPGLAHILMQHNLIDDYWLFVNPVLLGKGIALFKGLEERISLKLVESKTFASGVVCLHYEKA
jgi:dihydrofolate reductase